MKPILWVRHVKVSTGAGPGQPVAGTPAPRLSVVDKAAFVVLAAGLLALGGVLFAAGLALLLALLAGGAVVGVAAVARHRLFGRPAHGLAPGEIEADGDVVAPSTSQQPQTLPPFSRAPRAD
jgi:hypothetical protein